MRTVILLTVSLLFGGCRTGSSLPPVLFGDPPPVAVSDVPTDLQAREPGARRRGHDGLARVVVIDDRGIDRGPLPRYVIDGELLPTGTPEQDERARVRLATMESADVLAVSVLRGPEAAARFGPEAASGVILVTTRTGRAAARQGRQHPPRSPAP